MAFSITGRSILQTAFVMGTGDLSAQYLEYAWQQGKREEAPPFCINTVDGKRLTQMTTLGVAMNGVCVPLWLDMIWKRIPGRHLEAIVKKLVLDQVIYAPFMLVVVLGYTSVIKDINFHNNRTKEERIVSIKKDFAENLRQKGWEIFLTDCSVWPFASLINFMYIPKRFMVLYYSIISVGWNTYLSYTSWKALDSDCK